MPPRQSRNKIISYVDCVHEHNVNFDTRELYLHSDASDINHKTAMQFIKNLRILDVQNHNTILVHMYVAGGDWCDGMAVFDAVRQAKSAITFLAYASVSSMSTIVLQAADLRVLMPNCEFMVHHGNLSIEANYLESTAMVDINKKNAKKMLQILAQRCSSGQFFQEKGYSYSRITSYLDNKMRYKGDWYLSAEEAVYYGFADGVFGEKRFQLRNLTRNMSKVS